MFENFDRYEYYVTASLCFLALSGMGTTLTPTEFRKVARRPRTLLLIGVCQLVVGPLLAIGLSRYFEQSVGIAVGMLLVTALPGGLFSNIFALLSRSHVALSISATAVCTLGSLVTTSLVLKTFGAAHLPDQFRMPVQHILFEIGVCLLLPLMIGMIVRQRSPQLARPLGRFCVRAATILLAFYVVAAFQSGRIDLAAFGWRTHVAIILLDLLQIAACILLAWPFRVTSLESFTCQIEVVIRNVHLGLLLKASLFPAVTSAAIANEVMFVLLYYGGASVVTGVVMTLVRHLELRYLGESFRGPPPPELKDW